MRLTAAAAVLLYGVTAAAQQSTMLVGRVVRVGSGAAIPGVTVLLAPRSSLLTDSAGAFRFSDVPAGSHIIHVRRLGFAPESLAVELPLAAPITIELRETVQALDTVSVTGRENRPVRGKLAGFYDRQRYGFGTHLEAIDIERMLNRRLADILVAHVPGLRAIRSRRGGSATYIYSTRLGTGCYPSVYLDGAAVFSSGNQMFGGGSAESTLFDINSIDPSHVAAIEYYGGPATMPAEFNRTGSACGTLLIWTK